MKFGKRITLLCLCLTLCLLLLPTQAEAATVESGTCGANLTWTLDDTGTLTISGTGAMENYHWDSSSPTCSNHPWKNIASSITTVVIEEGVTTIGGYAFRNCDSLTSVTIGDSVTTIGWYAFEDCNSLTSVTIGDSVTTIGYYAFWYCDSLTSVTLPDSVTTIEDFAFAYCDSLTGIWAAEGNPNYSSDGAGVLFNKNKTVLIQSPGGLSGSYTIPDSVTTIGDWAFRNCDSLTSITIPDSVTTIGDWAFAYCDSLTSVTIPDSVTTIGEAAFWCCYDLKAVYYAGTQAQWQGISIGDGNTNLTNATIHYNYVAPERLPGDLDDTEGVTTDDVVKLLLYISMPDLFPLPEGVNADFTGDDAVTTEDAVKLLLHISMPDLFPL